jgi:hypothetical protein
MPKRSIRPWIFSAFACWLTLLASADDFNLARLALPSCTVGSEGLLPLDDPNSDFTESSESREPTTTSRSRLGCTSSHGHNLTRPTFTSPFALPTHGYMLCLGMNTPLRC